MASQLIFLMNWQIDTRLKPIKKEGFVPIQTPYGSIKGITDPAENFASDYFSFLCCDFNEAEIKKFADVLKLDYLNLKNIRMLWGSMGFLVIEVYCNFKLNSLRDGSEQYFGNVEEETQKIADELSIHKRLEEFDKIIEFSSAYLERNEDFYYGLHKEVDVALKKNGAQESSWNVRYIYNYQTFVDNEEEAECYRKFNGLTGDKIVMEGNSTWQSFANHLWLLPNGLDQDTVERLAYCPIVAAWEVLIFDVGAIVYKDLLYLTSSNKGIKNDVMRQIINHDNALVQELGITLRDHTTAQSAIVRRCRTEYMYDSRKNLFENGQKTLQIATDGIDSGIQSKSSKMMEIILTVLTAMSVYSVACDACSLLMMETESLSFHFLSSIIFVFATVIMLVIFLLSTRKK